MAWRRRRWRRRRLRRPRRRWRFRRRGRTYRRRYGGRRRVFRSRFRGYRRRAAVRRRRFRRKRQYKSVVTQWNPQHRVGCRIKGWLPMIMSIKGHFGEKSEVFTQSSDVPDTYIQCGGGVSWRHFTLGMFYQEHKLFRNRWSHTNVGYDLARYFGTKLRFWPHPWIDYLVYWETSFEMPERSEMSELHPANLLLIPKRMLIRSKQHRGRRRKLFIKPPPVHTNQWYFMKTWCNIPLFKVGIVPVNFNNSFLHTQTQYGVWIGYLSGAEVPVTIAWSQIDIEGQWPINCQTDSRTGGPQQNNIAMSPANGGDKSPLSGSGGQNIISVKEAWRRRVYYRWWWDDGVDNYIMVNKYNRNPIYDGMNSCEIQKVDMPYWKYFFGLPYLTSAQSNPQLCVPGMNPSVSWPWIQSSSKYVKSWRLPDYDEAREQLTRLVGSGPFVVNAQDVTFATRTLNLGLSYTSFWQWGGFRPSPDTTEDPCKIGDPNPPFPSKDRFAVSVEDPSLAEKITMHPWDFEQSGLYTQLALKRLISDVYPELSTEPPSVGQPPDRPGLG
nr:MAG: ORF1 [Torque teno polar bear virus 1]